MFNTLGNAQQPFGLKRRRITNTKDPRVSNLLFLTDPRIHFLISYGSKSSPVIRVLKSGNDLNEETKRTITEEYLERGIEIDTKKKKVILLTLDRRYI